MELLFARLVALVQDLDGFAKNATASAARFKGSKTDLGHSDWLSGRADAYMKCSEWLVSILADTLIMAGSKLGSVQVRAAVDPVKDAPSPNGLPDWIQCNADGTASARPMADRQGAKEPISGF